MRFPSIFWHHCFWSGVSRLWITPSSPGMLPMKRIGLAIIWPSTSAPHAPVSKTIDQTPGRLSMKKVATASKLKQGYLTGKNHQRHLAFSKGCKELRGLAVVEVLVEDRPTVDTQNGQPRLERLQNFCCLKSCPCCKSMGARAFRCDVWQAGCTWNFH